MRLPWKKRHSDMPRRRLNTERTARQQTEARRLTDNEALFRRNRTLVGSLSPLISSASELNADLRSPRAQTHHLTAHRRRLGRSFLIVAVFAGFLTWFLYEFTAGIRVSSATNADVSSRQERVVRHIQEYFAAHPVERLRPFLDEARLTEYLRSTVPEVERLDGVKPAGFAASRFDIMFRQPVASWLIGSDRYYVDKNGVPFRENYFGQPTVKIIDQSGVPQIAGTVVASSRFLRFVGLAVDTADAYGLSVERAIIPENTTRQIELLLKGHPYPVKLSLDRPVGEQIEDMTRAVRYMDKRGMTPKYIDVRVSGKAYYK